MFFKPIEVIYFKCLTSVNTLYISMVDGVGTWHKKNGDTEKSQFSVAFFRSHYKSYLEMPRPPIPN